MVKPATESKVYRFEDFELNEGERILTRRGERVAITPRNFDLLARLVRENGHLVSKEALIEDVWAEVAVEEGNLNRTISTLRRILGENRGENRFIETVPKRGYRFVAEVTNGSVNGAERSATETAVAPAVDPPFRRTRWALIAAVAAFVLAFGALVVGYVVLRPPASNDTAEEGPKSEPKRLTDNRFEEDGAIWGTDNQIRFIRFTNVNSALSYQVDPETGVESRPETPIKDLRTGTWSPDGKWVVFGKLNEPGREPFLARADGSEERRLPIRPGSLAWAPDSSRFAYNSAAVDDPNNIEIFIYDIAAAKSTVVAASPSFDANPSFSPDGRQIAFNSDRDGNEEIYLADLETGHVRRLTDHPAKDPFPVFSPDGTQIAFTSNRENETVGIYLLNVNDALPPRRLSDPAYDAEIRPGCWSPDGTRMVFTSNMHGRNFNVYTMMVEGPGPKVLASSPNRDLTAPAISPDGERLAFVARETGRDSASALIVREQRSGIEKTVFSGEADDISPAWSPDGRSIAFNCKNGGNTDICVADNTGNTKNLTDHPARDASPAWSRDGSEIVFASNRDGSYESYQLFVAEVNGGGGQRRLTRRDGYEMVPALSPADGRIYFAGDRTDGRSQGLDIFALAPDGSERILVGRRFHDSYPAVSPDGSLIAFTSQSDGNEEIYLVRSDGNGLLRLTRNAAIDTSPKFSPDGRSIVFASDRRGRFEIYSLPVPGH